MPVKQRSDYNELLKKAQELISSGKAKSIADLARNLKIQRSSLMSLLERNFGIIDYDGIMKARPKIEDGKNQDNLNLIGPEYGDEVEFDIDGNEGMIRSVVVEGQIKTVEQLLKLTGADKEFFVHNPKVKKWDVALKVKESKDREIVKVVPSIYIEAPLRRISPIAFEPVVSPIQIDLQKLPKAPKPDKNGIRRELMIFDPQIGFRRRLHGTELYPFHDRRVLDLALQICQEEQIDSMGLGGDWGDLSEWSSRWQPEPEFYWTTQPALLEISWWLTQLRMAKPGAKMRMLEGNHDLRMQTLIIANMRQAYKLKAVDEMELPPALSFPKLLALHTLDIEYLGGYPDVGYWLNNNVFVTHGDTVRSGPGDTAKAIVNKTAYTTIFGHIHRREFVTRRIKTHSGDIIHSAFCPGCACKTDGSVPGSKSDQQWQQGLAVVEYTEDSENIIPIAVKDGKMIYNGRTWTARDREAEVTEFLTKSLKE